MRHGTVMSPEGAHSKAGSSVFNPQAVFSVSLVPSIVLYFLRLARPYHALPEDKM